MVNSSKAPASAGAGASSSIAGAGSKPANVPTSGGAAGGSGGVASAPSPTLGAIPGSSRRARNGLRVELTLLGNGVGTQFPPDDSEPLRVKGQSLTRSGILATITAALALFADIDGSAQALKSKRQALKAATPGLRAFVTALKAALVGLFGRDNPVLENFGINPAKVVKLNAEQLTARKAKAAETRKLRGTQGKREKNRTKFLGAVEVQTSLSGNQAAGGNASPTGTNPSTAGAPTGAPPSGGGNPAPAPGSGTSQP